MADKRENGWNLNEKAYILNELKRQGLDVLGHEKFSIL
jgi:hypothetical protein